MRYFIWKISFIIFFTSCSTIPEISNEKKEGLYFYRSAGLSSMYGYGYPITLELNGERFKLGVASSKNMKPVIGKNTLKKISTGFVGELALNETPYHFEYRNGEYIEIGVSNLGPFEIQVKNASNQTIELRHASEEKLMSNLPPCRGLINEWYDCFGTFGHDKAGKYVGEFKSGKFGGYGVYTTSDGKKYEGYFENGILIRDRKTQQYDGSQLKETASNENSTRAINEIIKREQTKLNKSINLQITNTTPDANGTFDIGILTNADTASLKINGEEQGGRADGVYKIKKVARAGQETTFNIVAVDINGNVDSKNISVNRQVISSSIVKYAELNPILVKLHSNKDAVAIIIGIADYKNLPKADYANDDARVFYDYAIRALGIKPDNIKLLVDGDASEVGIYKAFKTWLPSKVRSSTDVYVFYSGHGLPTSDGKGLYLLPQQTDRDLISKTAIQMQEVISDIQSTKPKSVTLFLDACYSGQSRTGETLIASARPISIKSESRIFPENFTVITASQNDQISSSNPDLKHGIFSYYLMRGMEGDADTDKDGKITLGEMQSYLVENVGRQAGMMNRKQEPQLIGDANRVLVGR